MSKELDTEDELELAALELVSIDTYQCWSIPYGILFSETIPYNGLNRHTPGVDRHLIRIAPYEVRIPMKPSAQLAIESCRDLVSIYTTPPVDRHPRDSRAEDSAHSLQPTPIWDLCDKFSSISYPALPSINYLNSSKSASQVNKPRVLRKLVSPFDFAGNKKTIDRHTNDC